jgi:hypothetical protein
MKIPLSAYIPVTAAIFLGAYLLITVARWLHPALFTPTVALNILLIGLICTVLSLCFPKSKQL